MQQGVAAVDEVAKIRYLEVGCQDLSRSLDFYQGLLGFTPVDAEPGGVWLDAGAARLKLVEIPDGDLGGWDSDDLQCGIRHFGMRVGDVDAHVDRLRVAGVTATKPPSDVHGGMRTAFLTDPDGAVLELISGAVQHDRLFAPELAERDRRRVAALPGDAGPAFDHVAITAPDLSDALDFYVRTMGGEVIGQLRHDDDPRGMTITNLRLGSATLELITFTGRTRANPWNAGQARVGLRSVGFAVTEHRAAVEALTRAGAGAVMRPTADPLLIDPDGLPLTLTTR